MATTYINNNVKFHAFSKSPVSPDTTLGGAVNPSGHTITTSQVRSQDIPAFLNTFQGDKTAALSWIDTNYATPAHNDIVFYGGEFKAGFSTPKCLKYNATTSTWEDFDITKATTLKNADDKDVIAVHQNCETVFVDGGNNAATNSNRWSLFVKKSDGSILDHFVASTDKIVAGMPSLGYNALVLWNGAAIDEGELDANYVGNTFAGIVHLNKQYANGDDAKFKVTCFEYIGEKLDESITSISDSVKDIVNTTMQGVVASVGTTTAASTAGISVDSSVTTSPKIDLTTGSVTAGEAKLVTGGAVATVTDALEQSIAGAKSEAATNLAVARTEITAEIKAAKEQAIAGSTVTLTASTAEGKTGIEITPNGEPSNAFTIGIDQSIIATVASVTAISNIITDNKEEIDGKISTINGILEGLTTGDNSISAQISTAISNATSNADIVDSDISTKLVTAAQVSKYVGGEISAIDTGVTSISINGGNAQKGDIRFNALTEAIAGSRITDSCTISSSTAKLEQDGSSVYLKLANAVASVSGDKIVYGTHSDYIATAADADVIATFRASEAKDALADTAITGDNLSVSGAGISVTLGGKVGTPTLTGSVTTASYTPASGDTAASWTNSGYLVTGATVEAFVGDETAKTLDAAKAYSNSLHTTSVTYHVTDTLPTVPSGKEEEYKGRIYLVLTGKDGVVAADGARIEYMYVNEGTEEAPSWDWEQIGTTTADLSGYAKSVKINGQTYTATADNAGALDLGTVVNSVMVGGGIVPGDGVGANIDSVMAHIREGALYLGIASASESVMGVSKMFTGDLVSSSNGATDTAVSVKSAEAMYTSLSALANGKISSVNANAYLGLAGFVVSTDASKQVTVKTVPITSSDVLLSNNRTVINGILDGEHAIDTTLIAFDENNPENFARSARGSLTTWVGDMPNLVNGQGMFDSCTHLTTFCGDLSSLTNGYNMFYQDTALTSFCGDLSSLTDGNQMFLSCKLDAESLECIVDTINDVRSLTTSNEVTKHISIGYNCSAADAEAAKTAIEGKGWTCIMTYNA